MQNGTKMISKEDFFKLSRDDRLQMIEDAENEQKKLWGEVEYWLEKIVKQRVEKEVSKNKKTSKKI